VNLRTREFFFIFHLDDEAHAKAHLPLQNDDTIRPQTKSGPLSASTASKGAVEAL